MSVARTELVNTELSLDLPQSGTRAKLAPAEPPSVHIVQLSLASVVEIPTSLLKELNCLHCINLPESPDIKLGCGLPTTGHGGCKLVLYSWSIAHRKVTFFTWSCLPTQSIHGKRREWDTYPCV